MNALRFVGTVVGVLVGWPVLAAACAVVVALPFVIVWAGIAALLD